MVAYNQRTLDNIYIRKQADDASAAGCISPEEKTKIGNAYPVDFYTPNIFICIGLFLLTVLIVSCIIGLFMFASAGGGGSFSALLIFFCLACYGGLEYIVRKRKHFRSGVDYALLWMSAGLLYGAFMLLIDDQSINSQCIIIFAISLLFTIRFANFLMALLAYTSLLVFILNIIVEKSGNAQLIMPFVAMAASVAGWFLSEWYVGRASWRNYRQCLTVIKVAALTSFYLSGNYFIVREVFNFTFGPVSPAVRSISMGWLFWTLTLATPLLYIYQGVRKKDRIFLWTGLTLIAATVFTIRHYYSVLRAEWAMIIGGMGIIAIAYVLIKYLKTPRHGFTSLEQSNKHILENLNIESLVIAETFAGAQAAPIAANDFQFGGGSGGGGGAGGQF